MKPWHLAHLAPGLGFPELLICSLGGLQPHILTCSPCFPSAGKPHLVQIGLSLSASVAHLYVFSLGPFIHGHCSCLCGSRLLGDASGARLAQALSCLASAVPSTNALQYLHALCGCGTAGGCGGLWVPVGVGAFPPRRGGPSAFARLSASACRCWLDSNPPHLSHIRCWSPTAFPGWVHSHTERPRPSTMTGLKHLMQRAGPLASSWHLLAAPIEGSACVHQLPSHPHGAARCGPLLQPVGSSPVVAAGAPCRRCFCPPPATG